MCGDKGEIGCIGISETSKIVTNFDFDKEKKGGKGLIKVETPCKKIATILINKEEGVVEKICFDASPQIQNVSLHCQWCGVSKYCLSFEEVVGVLSPYGIKDIRCEKLLSLIYKMRSAN